jgi:Transglycosylase SLT domain
MMVPSRSCKSRRTKREAARALKLCFKLGPVPLRNKKVYICFVALLVTLAASPMRASEPISVLTPAPQRVTYVVRVDPRTGKLVRAAVSSNGSLKRSNKAPAAISALVEESARAHKVDPKLVDSVIQVESNYDQFAVSPKGAEGLMQLMPDTARMLGVRNSFDAKENIEAGVRYLKSLQDQFKDDRLALAAYNAGPGAVDRYKWVPPFKETQKYVEEVGRRYGEARAPDSVRPVPPRPDPEMMTAQQAPAEERHPKLEQFIDQDGRLHLKTAD